MRVPVWLIVGVIVFSLAIWPLVFVYNLVVGGTSTLDRNTIIWAVVIIPAWCYGIYRVARWARERYG